MTLGEAIGLKKGDIVTHKNYPKLTVDYVDKHGWVYCYGFGGKNDYDALHHTNLTRLTACNKPPRGWTCSRELGHEGPCAASQDKLSLKNVELAYDILKDANPHLPKSLAIIRRVIDEWSI